MAFFIIFTVFSPILAQDLNSHESAALECLLAMNADKTVNLSAKPIAEGVFKNSPDLMKYHDAIVNFFDKYICWDHLRDYFIEQYCAKFSESELTEMTAFFKSKTGIKYINTLPELQSLYAQLSQKVMQDNIDELGTIIKKTK
jgi:hypothetical protein